LAIGPKWRPYTGEVNLQTSASSPIGLGEVLNIEAIHADTYLLLGDLVWRDSENKVALA
jgi:hypothetical protein